MYSLFGGVKLGVKRDSKERSMYKVLRNGLQDVGLQPNFRYAPIANGRPEAPVRKNKA